MPWQGDHSARLPRHNFEELGHLVSEGRPEVGGGECSCDNAKNPTPRYVAYKDAETGNPIHQAILQQEERKRQEQIRRAT